MTPAAALALYRKACVSHKRADWRRACHELANVVLAAEHARQAPAGLHGPAKRGANLPAAGLFDRTARQQLEMF